MILDTPLDQWLHSHPLLGQLTRLEPLSWFNPALAPTAQALGDVPLTRADTLQALQASTHTLHAHSDQAQAQRMVDALLSLSVTYRQLIMPLVRAVESRVGADAKMHQEVERLEGMIDNLRGAPPAK